MFLQRSNCLGPNLLLGETPSRGLLYKEYVLREASDEQRGFQNFVAVLAHIEIETGDAVHTQASSQTPLTRHSIDNYIDGRGIDDHLNVDWYTEVPRTSRP